MISDEDAEEVISIAQNDHQKAILMSNALIKRLMDSQQCDAPDGNSAALHSAIADIVGCVNKM